jgi:SAM-dependent methyltransferase
MNPSAELHAQFGEIDIYLFDQLLRGRFDARRRVLDAGCGFGRNLVYFLRHGFDVYASDADEQAVRAVERLFASAGVSPTGRVHRARVESMPWTNGAMDAVLSSAVLHFARDADHFAAMLQDMWRVLAPGGLLFARLATSIGIEDRVSAAVGRVRLPDGSERFVVDERTLLDWTDRLGAKAIDPIKTTNVQNLRAMTTWVLEK